MTKQELNDIETEVHTIGKEMDWRDPNLEAQWWAWACQRLDVLNEILLASLKGKYRGHLRIIK